MGRGFRQLLVLVLALTFAASGIAARQCEAAHHAAAKPAQVEQSVHTGYAAHVVHDAQAQHGHHHAGAPDQAVDLSADGNLMFAAADLPAPADGHDCGKCAGMCTVVYGSTAGPLASDVFTAHPALFFCRSGPVAGGSVKVDPGIPKPIV